MSVAYLLARATHTPLIFLNNIYINKKTKSPLSTCLLKKIAKTKKPLDLSLIVIACKGNIVITLCICKVRRPNFPQSKNRSL
jgi:uncharacterized protein YejL (UPF0352 family)